MGFGAERESVNWFTFFEPLTQTGLYFATTTKKARSMLHTIAIKNYRSLLNVTLPLLAGPGNQKGIHLGRSGLLRPLSGMELSDGTLRYLLLVAALMTPRPPPLMVLNEPETSLHPDLLPSLGRLIVNASKHTQI